MPANLIDHTRSAYPYPLLIKQLLHTPLAVVPEQEIKRSGAESMFVGYGMSETGPVMAIAQVKTALERDPERELDLRTRAGLPIPLVDLRMAQA